MATGNRGRDLAVPFDQAALDELRARLADAPGAAGQRLPADYRDLLLDELALHLDASRRTLAAVRGRGALTRRGQPLAAMLAYADHQARIERLLTILGVIRREPVGGPRNGGTTETERRAAKLRRQLGV